MENFKLKPIVQLLSVFVFFLCLVFAGNYFLEDNEVSAPEIDLTVNTMVVSGEASRLKITPRVQTVNVGGVAKFMASGGGDQLQSTVWEHSAFGEQGPFSKRNTIGPVLEIKNVSLKDDGFYRASTKVKQGNISLDIVSDAVRLYVKTPKVSLVK